MAASNSDARSEGAVPIGRVAKAPRERLSLTWPLPVHDRLRLLVGIADAAGEATSESEIAAALVIEAAQISAEHLSGVLRRYRTIRLDELRGEMEIGQLVDLATRRRPGRPRRSA